MTDRYDPAVEAELTRLPGLDLHGLRDAWPARWGRPPRLRSPDLLRRMLAWRLQAETYGGWTPTRASSWPVAP